MNPINFRHIRAVSFDAGGTLLEPWPSVGHVYAAAALPHLGIAVDPALLNRQFREAWQQRGEFDYSRTGWLDLVRHTFKGVCSDPEPFFHELYQRFEQPDAWLVYDDVLPTLGALQARGLKLAVISNWDERLRPLLEKVGLAQYFEVITLSIEAGVTKPSPQIFQQTVQKLGLRAEQVLHVGDSQREDYAGPQALGMPALLVKRGTNEERPPHVLTTLSELTRLVDGRESHL